MKVEFEPGDRVDASKISMVQAVKTQVEGEPIVIDPSQEQRMVEGGPGEGFRIDRITSRDNPIFGGPSLGTGGELKDTPNSGGTFQLGWRHDGGSGLQERNAWLHDRPGRRAARNSSMVFETTALAIDGAQKDSYYGSVEWGWERDGEGNLSKKEFRLVSGGTPSNNFMAAAARWNGSRARGTVVTREDDTVVYRWNGSGFGEDYRVPRNIRVTRVGSVGDGRDEYQRSNILDGDHAGQEGYFKVTDLVDRQDGAETVDLPV